MNCQIVNVNGVAFRNFLTVVNNGYFIKSAVITDSDSATKTKDRAINLKKDFDGKRIQVCISVQTTFEKELIAANSTGTGRDLIKKAINNTRPHKSKETEIVNKFTKKLIPDEVFDLIGEYKAEFAFDLLGELEKNSNFRIPPYIINAFKFVGVLD
jgi:putative ATP-dependent endonuclease of OLD family